MTTIHVSANDFEKEVLQAKEPVLVDFWAAWCGPCKMLAPIVEMVSDQVSDVKFCKVNIDEAMDIAMKYKIASIPTLSLFKNGEEVKKSVGVISKDELISFLG